MIDLDDIRNQPTSLDHEYIKREMAAGAKGFHESVLRSWRILEYVKYLLDNGTAPAIVRELIALLESPR